MSKLEVNKKLLPLKSSYFFFFGCIGPIYGFLPTIARQLGYSIKTYGTIMMTMSFLSMLVSLTVGIIFDKYHVKKKMILFSIAFIFLDLILFMFVPKITPEPIVELECDSRVMLRVYNENQQNNTISSQKNVNELITCKLKCHDVNLYDLFLNNQSYNKNYSQTRIVNQMNNDYNDIIVTITFNNMKYIENSFVFHVIYVRLNDSIILPNTCQNPFKEICNIKCSNRVIMDEATNKTYRGNVLLLPQFWIFIMAVAFFIINVALMTTAQNTNCLEILENKAEDFGRQKCWASIGWGFFSIFIGWLVDAVSDNKNEINYLPVFYSGIILTVLNFFFTSKIQVKKIKKSKGQFKSICELFSKHYMIVFYIWAMFTMFFHSIITHFLFWYLDDLVSENKDYSQMNWLKTLQGLAQGVQCFGGEIPFFFWSGWIIRKIGHVNSMALSLASVAVRMYLYTIITNPAWIILIELLNGVSYALAMAVKMSYAKIISPPTILNSMIGILHFCDCVGESLGSLVGGYLFDEYGGLWSFRFFAFTSALMCLLNIFSNIFGLTKEMKNKDFDAVPVETSDNKII